MKSALSLILFFTATLFVPMAFSEEFEAPKVWLIVAFGCLAALMVDWRELKTDRVGQLLFAFAVSSAVSAWLSIDPHMSLHGNFRCANGALVAASYLVFYLAAREWAEERMVWFVIAGGAAVAGYALFQVTGHDFMTWYGTLQAEGYTRPPSTLGHPNFVAGYLAMVLPFVFYRFDVGTRLERVAMAALSVAMLAVIFFCQSRGMWVATFAAVVTYVIYTKVSKNHLVAYALATSGALLVVTLIAPPGFKASAADRLENLFKPGPARLEYPKAAVRIWRKYPVFGAGTDAFETAFQHERTPFYWQIERGGSPHRAHNDFLNVLATQGALGALIWLAIGLCAYFRLVASQRAIKAPVAAALVAFYVAGLTSFSVVATGTLFIFCLAIL